MSDDGTPTTGTPPTGTPTTGTPATTLTLAEALAAARAQHNVGQLDAAEALYRRVLDAQPDQADALHMLGVVAYQRGDPVQAAALIGRAAAARPNDADLHVNLANTRHAAGQLTAAIESYQRVIALQPVSAQAYAGLSRALNDLADHTGALAAAQRAVALDPKLSDARVQMAVALAALNRLPEAGQAYQQALLLNPDQPEVLSRFALVLSRLDLPDAALTCHHRAIELRPDNAELHLALASSLMHHRDTPAAIAALRQALALNPTCAEAWQRLGTCLSTTGDFDQAGAAFRQALALDADDIEASRGLAAINQPASPQPSGIPLGDAAAGAEPAEVARLTAILAQSDLPSEQRIAAGFAAAERLDRQDRYDEAFACVATANALARAQDEASGQAFAIGPLRRQVNEAIAHCTPDFFAHTRGWGNPSALPVLVVGMPRSGTTLVEQIAASHAAVVGAGELLDLNQAARLLMLANPGRAVADWDAVAARSHADAYVARLAALGGDAARVVDKMPDNVLVLGIAAALLPRARVILCRRDLRDVCLSCHFQHFAEGQPFSHDLIDCAHRALEVERLMVHWRAVLPVPVLEMRYEALVGDPESEIRRLIDFLGLPWDPACLDFHRTARPILTASGWQVRQPLYATSVGRWRHYARHLGPLLATLAGKTAQKA